MPVTKRMICLANSRKLSGRCIAGVELADGEPQGWIRPVSSRKHEEVSEKEREYEDGSDPSVLDIIDVPLLEPRPHSYQAENWLLDPDWYWVKTGQADTATLQEAVSPATPLWVNGRSTYHGRNDEIPLDEAETLDSSLTLIFVDALEIAVFAPGEAFGDRKRRVQAKFEHAGAEYRLWVTDPRYERSFLAQPNGRYTHGASYLTISLGEPYLERNAVFKLVAAIIEDPPDHA
ncbi:MAG: hypothetical protein GY798_21945 [Hyphomicrobiales bacterium]|nr:hypothetical protein [Hyphomicrobiales bacterium]